MQIIKFIKAFLVNPKGVSTIFPATKYLAKAVVSGSEIKNQKVIIEIGVGTGALTSEIVNVLKKDQSYTGFEIDKTFFKYLKDTFIKKHKLKLKGLNFKFINESAENILEHFENKTVDVVVSSLPWSLIDDELQDKLLQQAYDVLKPDGLFTFYNCSNRKNSKKIKVFKEKVKSKFRQLEKGQTVYKNFPPATVWIAKK